MSSVAGSNIRPTTPATGRTGLAIRRHDDLAWLLLVAIAYTCAQLVFVATKQLGLSWDEVVYVSQVSLHAPASAFSAPRARGISLLTAPVALLTSSVLSLRVYLSVLSGAGLFLALLAWRRLRPAWNLALAGLFYGGLWITQYFGPQAMPDQWVAFSALAAVGLFLTAAGPARQAESGSAIVARPTWPVLGGLAVSNAVAALVRPGDALYLSAALLIATAVVRRWRRWKLALATAAGFAAGAAEWVVEAYLRFGGPLARLQGASGEQGGFGLHLGIVDELRALNGPILCRPCTSALTEPAASIWWFALPALAVLGILAARHRGQAYSAVLATVCGLAVGFQYLVLLGYAAPRFLLPVYALLAIPVADALGWLAVGLRRSLRPVTITLLAALLLAQLTVQHAVLEREVARYTSFFHGYGQVAAALHALGVKPPCLINGYESIPIAFYSGCGSAASAQATAGSGRSLRVAVIELPHMLPPAYVTGWHRIRLAGLRPSLRFNVYLPPNQASTGS